MLDKMIKFFIRASNFEWRLNYCCFERVRLITYITPLMKLEWFTGNKIFKGLSIPNVLGKINLGNT